MTCSTPESQHKLDGANESDLLADFRASMHLPLCTDPLTSIILSFDLCCFDFSQSQATQRKILQGRQTSTLLWCAPPGHQINLHQVHTKPNLPAVKEYVSSCPARSHTSVQLTFTIANHALNTALHMWRSSRAGSCRQMAASSNSISQLRLLSGSLLKCVLLIFAVEQQ